MLTEPDVKSPLIRLRRNLPIICQIGYESVFVAILSPYLSNQNITRCPSQITITYK